MSSSDNMSSSATGSSARLDLFPIDYSFSDSDQDDEFSRSPCSALHRLGSSSAPNIASQAEQSHEQRHTNTSLPYRSLSSSCKPPSTGLARNATGDPTWGRLLLPMQFLEGRRVSRGGKVLDHNGEVLGRVVKGNVQDCAGAYVREEGEIISAAGEPLGFVAVVAGNAARDAYAEWRNTANKLDDDDEEYRVSPPQIENNSAEAIISTNAMKCIEMAKNSERRRTSTFLELQGEATQKIEFEKIERNMNSLVGQLQSIEHDISTHMHPKLYEKLPFGEVTATYNKILAAIAEQRTWRIFGDESAAISGGLRPKVKLAQAEIIVVDEKEAVADMVDVIWSTLDDAAAFHLALDLQGKQLGHGGDISIATIYVPALTRTYLLDVAVLGEAAFNCSGTGIYSSIDLRRILENPAVKKLMFDCRLPSIAVHNVYGIKLAGVIDAQLAFCATRTKPKDRKQLIILSKAAIHGTAMHKEDQKTWKSDIKWGNVCLVLGEAVTVDTKTACEKIGDKWQEAERFVAEMRAEAGQKECNARPIPELVSKYCVAQVVLLGPLLEYCMSHPVWNEALAKRVEEETAKRLGMRELEELPNGDKVWNAAPEGWADFEHGKGE